MRKCSLSGCTLNSWGNRNCPRNSSAKRFGRSASKIFATSNNTWQEMASSYENSFSTFRRRNGNGASLDRIDHSEKNWKFSSNDASERDFWDDYMGAYEEMIQETATKESPWYVVPADNKWFTRAAVAAAVIEALASLDLEYPEVGKEKLKELAMAKKKLLK